MPRKTLQFIIYFSALSLLLITGGCVGLVPDRFEASLRILGNYGYVEYAYRGEVFVPELAEEVKEGKKTQAEVDKTMREVCEQILRDDKAALNDRQFKELRYLGKNRFYVNQAIKASYIDADFAQFQTETSKFFVEIEEEAISGKPRIHSKLEIKAFLLEGATLERLNGLGSKRHGVFRLETDCKIISHNASSLSHTERTTVLEWRIGSQSDRPAKAVIYTAEPYKAHR